MFFLFFSQSNRSTIVQKSFSFGDGGTQTATLTQTNTFGPPMMTSG
jgi:hypothetical protein